MVWLIFCQENHILCISPSNSDRLAGARFVIKIKIENLLKWLNRPKNVNRICYNILYQRDGYVSYVGWCGQKTSSISSSWWGNSMGNGKIKKIQKRCAWPIYQNDKCKCKCNFSTIQFTDFLLVFKKRQNAVLSFAQLSIIRVLRDLDE